MSPEPEVQVNYSEVASGSAGMFVAAAENNAAIRKNDPTSAKEAKTSSQAAPGIAAAGVAAAVSEILAPRKQRERRNQSPSTLALLETFPDAMSPASSSSASQANSGDVTFEPTIEMMVDDFDDEGTLNEEEALAALECQDPHDEIATLREESEMPIEELLAKYGSLPRLEPPLQPPRKKAKKSVKRNKSKKQEHRKSMPAEVAIVPGEQSAAASTSAQAALQNPVGKETDSPADVIVIESGDEENMSVDEKQADTKEAEDVDDDHDDGDDAEQLDGGNDIQLATKSTTEEAAPKNAEKYLIQSTEIVKKRRSHLLDLYPGETFSSVVNQGDGKVIPLEIFYGEEEEDEDDEYDEADDGETESDYVKKTIMVGSAYQAVIPVGLSQYGDVLPYENEDKLIWEPCQVGEREVEEYLVKARDIKPTLADDDEQLEASNDETAAGKKRGSHNHTPNDAASGCGENNTSEATALLDKSAPASVCSSEAEQTGVIKDNEQALHLLVQCGYDFKEALRRKRLNAVPMTGSMSIWSEEECHKFEEGIQKFGKDFLKIRQNQVRTRSMRELVQFYYLWKKSERRDNDFANSNTVDHMDIYLNEGGDYGPNTGAVTGVAGTGNATALAARKVSVCAQKNFSIMIGGSGGNGLPAVAINNMTLPPPTLQGHNATIHSRRRGGVGSTTASAVAASAGGFLSPNNNSESSQNIVATAGGSK